MDVSHDNVDPITEQFHENSWSANLEQPQHADRDLLLQQAIAAIDHTASGHNVNLVTHADHGHPEQFLYDVLESDVEGIDYEYIEQCGCGGHVTRVHVESRRQSRRVIRC